MIGIVIVTHGGLAKELAAIVEHVFGAPQDMVAIAISPDDVLSEKQLEIDAAVAAADQGRGVILLTDMFGGTPSNLAVKACHSPDHRVIAGVNMPMLIKLSRVRHRNIDHAVEIALRAGRKYMDCCVGPDLSRSDDMSRKVS